MITDEQLQALERVAAMATDGPWHAWNDGEEIRIGPSAENPVATAVINHAKPEDYAFLVLARTAVPSLLEELRQARAELDEMKRKQWWHRKADEMIAEAHRERDAARAELAEAKQARSELDMAREVLSRHLNKAKHEAEEARAELAKAKAELADMADKLRVVKSDNHGLYRQVAEANKGLRRLTRENEEYTLRFSKEFEQYEPAKRLLTQLAEAKAVITFYADEANYATHWRESSRDPLPPCLDEDQGRRAREWLAKGAK